ncbi:hypothetical protein IC582_022294 [Cucumis melo]|uniref:Geraniol 8-hydroxylase-like n=1 Tax=Cucumis melo var. makuwa TaxID=1194695 RepID=A0A5A7THP5_CUCMM|nr:geraniol 8-hydroxylase-like [Cucumis melo var. makuwa]
MELMMCMLFVSFIVSCLSLLLLFNSSNKRTHSKLPPGPKGYLVIGNLMDIGDKPHQSLANLAKSHGPIMSLKLGQMTSIVISSAAMAKEVLQTHDQQLCDRTIPCSSAVYDHDKLGFPWLPVSDVWRTLRKVCNNHMFSQKILDSTEIIRRKQIQRLVDNVREKALEGEAVDIEKAAFGTILNMLSNMIFSVDLADPNSEWAKELKETVWGIMEESGKPDIGDYFPLLKKMDIKGSRRRMMVYIKKFLDMIGDMMEKRMELEDMEENHDMLYNLLNLATENDGSIFDIYLIKHLILVLLPAGSDTTTSMVEWAMAELLKNPEALSKARRELMEVMGKNRPIEESDLSKLPFLQAIAKETLRLHPPVPLLLPRKAREDTEIGGFIVPKDAQVIVNAWYIQRDKDIWEDSELFKPERFLELSEIDYKGRNMELIPFGAGRRICPGLPLANRMGLWILGSLIHSFDWKLEDGITPKNMNMDEKVGLTLVMAHPLKAIPIIV